MADQTLSSQSNNYVFFFTFFSSSPCAPHMSEMIREASVRDICVDEKIVHTQRCVTAMIIQLKGKQQGGNHGTIWEGVTVIMCMHLQSTRARSITENCDWIDGEQKVSCTETDLRVTSHDCTVHFPKEDVVGLRGPEVSAKKANT